MRFILLLAALAVGSYLYANDFHAEEFAAAEREQQELQERANALAEQLEDAKRLEKLQEEYLEKLKNVVDEEK